MVTGYLTPNVPCVLGQSKDKSEHSSLIKVEVNLDHGELKIPQLSRNEIPTDELKRAKQKSSLRKILWAPRSLERGSASGFLNS